MHSTSPDCHQLQPEDRMTLARLQRQNQSIRAMAHVLNRSPSSISRELLHQSMPVAMPALMPTSTGGKMPDRSADAMQIRVWFVRCSSPFLAGTLVARANCLDTGRIYPKAHKSRVSHKTINNCIYAPPVGELRRELVVCLRQAHHKRTPAAKAKTGGARFLTC